MTDTALHPKPIVLIPAYQPGQALVDTVRKLLAAGLTVVVVNDGSEAAFDPIFKALDPTVHVIAHSVNRGKGAALKTGYAYIRDNFRDYIIITADSDGQHAVADIKKMVQTYPNQPHALLLGVRTFENDNVPPRSKLGNILTRKVFSLVTKQNISDTQTGLRAFDSSLTEFMLGVSGERFEYETNVLLACSSEGVAIAELPIRTIYTDNNASSHFDPIKDSWAIYKEIIKFASSSLLAFGIDYGLFIVFLHLTGSWALASSVTFANVAARVISASINFMVNKHLVFKHKAEPVKGAVQYALLAAGILLGNTLLLTVLTSMLHLTPSIAKVVTEITLFCISYIVQRNVVFARRKAL